MPFCRLTKRVPPFFGAAGVFEASASEHALTAKRLMRATPAAKVRRKPAGLLIRIRVLAGADGGRHTSWVRAELRSVTRVQGGGSGVSASRPAHSRTKG